MSRKFIIDNVKTDLDVIKGKGGIKQELEGNQYFRELCQQEIEHYNALEKDSKKDVAVRVVRVIKARGGRFLDFDEDAQKYFEVDEKTAINKAMERFKTINKNSKKNNKKQKVEHQEQPQPQQRPDGDGQSASRKDTRKKTEFYRHLRAYLWERNSKIANDGNKWELSKEICDLFGLNDGSTTTFTDWTRKVSYDCPKCGEKKWSWKIAKGAVCLECRGLGKLQKAFEDKFRKMSMKEKVKASDIIPLFWQVQAHMGEDEYHELEAAYYEDAERLIKDNRDMPPPASSSTVQCS